MRSDQVQAPLWWLTQKEGEEADLPAVAGGNALLHLPVGLSGLNVDMRSSGGAWTLANLHVSGYYRVNYDRGNWERLLAQLGSRHQVKRVGACVPVPPHQ